MPPVDPEAFFYENPKLLELNEIVWGTIAKDSDLRNREDLALLYFVLSNPKHSK
jgi:hypothetical protein